MKIKFILKTLEGNQLLFQVLEMDERFRRGKDGGTEVFKARNGWRVGSLDSPNIEPVGKTIFLRGRKLEKDKKATIITASFDRDAVALKSEIIAALQDWAVHWGGFQDVQDSGDIICI